MKRGLLLFFVVMVLAVPIAACSNKQDGMVQKDDRKNISDVQGNAAKQEDNDPQGNGTGQKDYVTQGGSTGQENNDIQASGIEQGDAEKEFAAFLEEVNSKKRKRNASREKLDSYRYDFSSRKPQLTKKDVSMMKSYNKKKVKKSLSVEAAKKEVSWLFRLFRSQYGLYTYYGGDAVFEKREKAIKKELGTEGMVSVKSYERILHQNLEFITDNHLTIGDRDFSADITLFSNEETHYVKKDGVFYREDVPGDAIRLVNGEPPERYLKRAISETGRLTYYPYAMEKTQETCPCRILYESGKEEDVTLKPARYAGGEMVTQLYDFKKHNGMGYIELNVMLFEDEDEYMAKEYRRFLKDVPKMKKQENLVFDLRNNGGGNMVFVEEWFLAFTGKKPQPNYSTLRIRPVKMGGVKEMDRLAGQWGMEKSGKYYYCQYPEEQYLENMGRRMFVLTSRRTASAAEGFVDLANNMENTVVIGTNTGGVFTNMANYSMAMPYSRLYLEFGECLMYYDSAYFKESYGMEPDLYLTGENLEDRLEKFFGIYVHEEELVSCLTDN